MSATRAHTTVHIDVGSIPDDRRYVIYDARGVGIWVAEGALSVVLSGTPAELHAFATELHRHARRAARQQRELHA